MTMLAGSIQSCKKRGGCTLGHTFGVRVQKVQRVHRVQKVQRVVVAAASPRWKALRP